MSSDQSISDFQGEFCEADVDGDLCVAVACDPAIGDETRPLTEAELDELAD